MNISLISRRFVSRLTEREAVPPAQCIIGIGQGSVEALLTRWEGRSLRIMGTGRAPHPVHFGSDPAGRIIPVARACRRAVDIALEEARRSSEGCELPEEAVVGLPVPPADGRLLRTAQGRPNPHNSITEAEVTGLLRRMKRLAGDLLPPGGSFLDIGPLALFVDGYESTDPRGLKGNKLEVKANVWFLNSEAWRAVEALVEHLDFGVVTLTAIPRIFPFLTGGKCWLLECNSRGGILYLLDRGFTLGWKCISPEGFYKQLEEALCELALESDEAPFLFYVAGGGAMLAHIEAFLHRWRAHKRQLFPHPFRVASLRADFLAELRGPVSLLSEPENLYSLTLAWWAAQKQHGLPPLEALADRVWH